jgi:hypothetical protein
MLQDSHLKSTGKLGDREIASVRVRLDGERLMPAGQQNDWTYDKSGQTVQWG